MYDEDKFIDELDAAAALDGTELFPILQSDETVYTLPTAIRTWLQSKGYMPRAVGAATASTVAPNADTTDLYYLSALNQNCTFSAPTGSPQAGQRLTLRIRDDGTSRTLTFDAVYRFSASLAAPAATTINRTMYLEFVYNREETKFDCVNYLDNFS